MTIAELRYVYKSIREAFQQGADLHPPTFDRAVKALLPPKPTPQDYVDTALTIKVPCRKCMQTGLYVTSVVNGRPVCPGGVCYRCQGDGQIDYIDAKRNTVYDLLNPTQKRMIR